MKILVADDDAELRGLLGFTLSQAGFDVRTAPDGRTAIAEFLQHAPDLVLLDVNMPAPNGLEVCREIRARCKAPIMILTARDHEDDLIAAFDAGADDYVSKPFSPRTLLARVRALSRRAVEANVGAIVVGGLQLDLEQHFLRWQTSAPVRLTPLELKAMQLLMSSIGRTIVTDRLLMHVWGRSTARERRMLKQLVYRLRLKLSTESISALALQATPGAGYKLVITTSL